MLNLMNLEIVKANIDLHFISSDNTHPNHRTLKSGKKTQSAAQKRAPDSTFTILWHTSTLESGDLPATDPSLCVFAYFDFRDTTCFYQIR